MPRPSFTGWRALAQASELRKGRWHELRRQGRHRYGRVAASGDEPPERGGATIGGVFGTEIYEYEYRHKLWAGTAHYETSGWGRAKIPLAFHITYYRYLDGKDVRGALGPDLDWVNLSFERRF
jgi:hypothetical protein